jgi:hypothetical protein
MDVHRRRLAPVSLAPQQITACGAGANGNACQSVQCNSANSLDDTPIQS